MEEKRVRKRVFRFRRGTVLLVLLALGIVVLVGMDSSRPAATKAIPQDPKSDAHLALLVQDATEHLADYNKRTSAASWGVSSDRLISSGQEVLRSIAAFGAKVLSTEEQKEVMQSLKESGDYDEEEELPLLHPSVFANKVQSLIREANLTAKSSSSDSISAGGGGADLPSQPLEPGLLAGVTPDKVPLAGLAPFDGRLMITDGSCSEKDCLPHGFCYQGKCQCVVAFSGDNCRTARRPFAKLRSSFEGKFVLNVGHVRRVHGVKYPVFVEGQRTVFDAPFFRAGKVNRIVWAHLQKGKLGELDPMMAQALLDLLPGGDLLQNAAFNSCAIVGNSGFNLLFKDGAGIDGHDAVFRLYNAPSGNQSGPGGSQWASHVGRRTTLRVIDGSMVGWHEGNEIRLMNVFNKADLYNHFETLNKDPEQHAYLFDPNFAVYVTDNVGTNPSPFTLALFLALQKCATVDLYGTRWSPGYGVPELYYEKSDANADIMHLEPQETQLVQAFARLGLVHLKQPCVAGCEAESGVKCQNCAPGSACPCGRHHPLPVALPGFCQVTGNFTCFFKCEGKWKAKCPGGPGSSECPRGFNPANLPCAQGSDVGESVELPWWANKGGMKEFDAKFERSTRHKSSRA